jgi:hypothetical protein
MKNKQGYPFSSIIQNSVWILRHNNKAKEGNIRSIQIGNEEVKLSLFVHIMFLYLKCIRLHQRTLRCYEHFQQSKTMQNQHTKINKLSVYQHWTCQENNQVIPFILASTNT